MAPARRAWEDFTYSFQHKAQNNYVKDKRLPRSYDMIFCAIHENRNERTQQKEISILDNDERARELVRGAAHCDK